MLHEIVILIMIDTWSDFGLEELDKLIKDTNFPWLMSNAWDVKTKKVSAQHFFSHLHTCAKH